MEANITFGDKYGPAMSIADQAAADSYFEECVRHCMTHGKSRSAAERIERSNLGYFAGYYDSATRARVERLFKCAHPFFGSISDNGVPSTEQAMKLGNILGRL